MRPLRISGNVMGMIKIKNWNKPGEFLWLDEQDLGKNPKYERYEEPKAEEAIDLNATIYPPPTPRRRGKRTRHEQKVQGTESA